ncbi:T9SS type A sorting domain-containing protein [Polaribacter pectinis]|uniref:T9SS type A sorting domain-containing protein n=1 Tax=Polaribacter pectinis TaxID=2738844 RepID=A0A7G9LDI4_9FLAO|nr:T9SS type A sorting domain-containing protein [Polaribacter pectinis]QNM86683.1 T9SS type A sorting domain-containing protein [Polaribacter pectinis]
MKHQLLKNYVLLFSIFITTTLISQNVNIPDYEFKQALLNYSPAIDTNNDNQISLQEAAAVTVLNISGYQSIEDIGGLCPDPNDPNCIGGGGGIISFGISDFTGIEAFTNLTSLTCNNNELISLDVSTLTSLTYLDCSNNINSMVTLEYYPGIGTLVLPTSGTIETLICNNNDLSTLDTSSQTALITLNTSFNRLLSLTLPTTNTLTSLNSSRNQLTTLDVSLNTSLVSLTCDNNNINNLALPNTNTLTFLNCQRNQITTLDTSNYTSLTSLICDNNYINNLILPNTNTLKTLKCFVNQIPSLDVSNNAGLTHLDCRNNPLTTLDVLQNIALTTINCSSTQLTNLDLTNNTLLTTLACGGNQIIDLDLSRQTSLNTLYCNNNQLTSLNIKNGNNTALSSNRYNTTNNPNLNLICVDDISYANSTFINKDAQSYYSDICSFIPTNSNTITGTVSFDFDANGCDPLDTKSINTKLTSSSTNTSNVTFTDANGQYLMYTQEANNTLDIFTNLPSFFTVTPTTQNVNFTGSGATQNIDFCITANAVVNDVKVSILPYSESRPGFQTNLRIYYENLGSTILSGDINLTFDDSKEVFISATETVVNQTTNSLSWNYTNLKPFEKKYIDVIFEINRPTDAVNPVNNGDILSYSCVINPTSGDANPTDNTANLDDTTIGSYDPNDIIALEGNFIDENEVSNYLNYRIRFQNTGTASAINIVVKNELDTDLDWDSFEPITASHDYRISINDDNKVDFIFENIHLADSTSNEPVSHGWIYYKIKPKSTFAIGDVIDNTANIYFDFNPPVITNTYQTQIAEPVIPSVPDLKAKVYPNPTRRFATIKVNLKGKLKVYNKYGVLVYKHRLKKGKNNFDFGWLPKGRYFLKIKSKDQIIHKKLVIKRRGNGHGHGHGHGNHNNSHGRHCNHNND